jgi:hypothetical protein
LEIDFQQKMTVKADDELQNYLVNYDKYSPAAIRAAFEELKNRGKVFTENELDLIEANISSRQQFIDEREKSLTGLSAKNIVDDAEAPLYYSQNAIYMFSAAFSVLAGAVLLSINLKNTGNKRVVRQAIFVSVVYLTIILSVLSFLPRNTGLTIAVNGFGAWILNKMYWERYIGKDTKYRAKPIWKPLIICCIIMIPIILATISTHQ